MHNPISPVSDGLQKKKIYLYLSKEEVDVKAHESRIPTAQPRRIYAVFDKWPRCRRHRPCSDPIALRNRENGSSTTAQSHGSEQHTQKREKSCLLSSPSCAAILLLLLFLQLVDDSFIPSSDVWGPNATRESSANETFPRIASSNDHLVEATSVCYFDSQSIVNVRLSFLVSFSSFSSL